MNIDAVSDIDLLVEAYESFPDEKIDSCDKKVQDISNQLSLCHSNRSLKDLSKQVVLGNKKNSSTLSRIYIEKNKNDNPKGDISVIYKSESEDGTGRTTMTTRVDSEGNINATITIKKDF